MAPSASMLFLSYHQLHGPAAAEAPRKQETEAAGGGGFRFSVGSVFSLGAFARRREEAAPAPVAEPKVGYKRDAVAEKSAAAAELDDKFEEALRLSCWSI